MLQLGGGGTVFKIGKLAINADLPQINNQQFCQSTPDLHFVDWGGDKAIGMDPPWINTQQFCQSTPDLDFVDLGGQGN